MVSIILCTYNRASLLPNAIRSVLRQTVRPWELIIIDDGSTDATGKCVRQFQRKDNRILYHFQTNKGLARARNEGIRRASGTVLCFLDSDDELAPDHLERRLRYLDRHPEIDFLHGGMKLIGPRAKQYVVDMTDTTRTIHLSKCHVGGTFFFRRSVLRFVRTFRPLPFGEDFDFFRRAAKHCAIKKVRYPTYLYHLDSENRLCDAFTEKLLK
jgi:glycosyltransferase involved in cell wall biosynthesis